jgi:tetraacyldisaccharide 4'-kinase
MHWLEPHWQRITAVSAALYPFSLFFRSVAALRRAAYAASVLRSQRLRVPVIVVGNITVGGTGKTPLVLWLAALLSRHGMRPGIVSRGYGGNAKSPRSVAPSSNPRDVADEPLLLAQRSGCPVFVGVDRCAAGQALLQAHPECDVIVSDDGLQHYALARDIEIAVIDGARGLGNGLMLPAGPLREPPSRLRSVDAVVTHSRAPAIEGPGPAALHMTLEGSEFHNLLNASSIVRPAHFQGRRVHAIAGIGNPARFFEHLRALGLQFEAHAFPDHHRYTAADLAFRDESDVVMTEKDAVKCAAFAARKHWALRVDAVPDPMLGELVLRKLTTVSS